MTRAWAAYAVTYSMVVFLSSLHPSLQRGRFQGTRITSSPQGGNTNPLKHGCV